ncbi:MAG: SMC-Scp complex subunit ScpB [Woeseia sp.]
MEVTEIKYFLEAAMLAAGKPLSIDQMQGLFDEKSAPEKAQLRDAIKALQDDYEPRGIEVTEVASGFRMQVKTSMADRLERLWEERPPRYSRALFETLALIAYRQPLTRGEIEEVRGVAVSSNIMRSLLEREWIRVVGHRDVPGRPAMFATTKLFLDYFGLKKLEDLPPLADLSDWESLRVQLNLPAVEDDTDDTGLGDDDSGAEEESGGAVVTALPVAGRRSGADEDIDVVVANDADAATHESSADDVTELDADAADAVDDGDFDEDELRAVRSDEGDSSASNG